MAAKKPPTAQDVATQRILNRLVVRRNEAARKAAAQASAHPKDAVYSNPATFAGGARTAVAQGAKTGSTVPVKIGSTVFIAEVARDVTPAAGDVLLCLPHGGKLFAVARLYVAPASDNSSSNNYDPPVGVAGVLVCAPVETASTRFGVWHDDTDDVIQGETGQNGNHTGCAFYGLKPRSLSGATVTKATLQVRREAGGDYAAKSTLLWLIAETERGAILNPTRIVSTSGPALKVAQTLTFAIPTEWGQRLVDGTAGGLAVYSGTASPYVRFAGRGTWSPAFTLSIAWRRG